MNFIDAFILGIIEGVTEFLPISSTGHLMLAAHVLKLQQTEFLKSFEIAIQFGAILSVVALYGRSLLVNPKILLRVIAAFIPTAILGLVLYKIVKHYFLGSYHIVLWSLFIGGILMILFEKFHKEKEDAVEDVAHLPWWKVVLIGVFQSLAMIPGVSRSAATILGGLLLGLKRKSIVEFSFLLAIPTMAAATGFDLLKSDVTSFTANEIGFLLVGMITSFIVALLSIRFLLSYIQRHSFIAFGVYRIAIALIFFLIFH